jgi:predicted MFS family arabinose efflux permease
VLAFAAFAIGTAELVVVGILGLVACSEHISDGQAGTIVTAYALGIAVFLPVYGLAAAVGTLMASNGGILLALALVRLVGSSPVLVAVALAVWGFCAFAAIPALQLRLLTLAGPGADLAATLGASGVNGGIALGSVVRWGGIVGRRPESQRPRRVAAGSARAAADLGYPAPAASRPIDTTTDHQRKGYLTCTSSRERPETSAASWYGRCRPTANRSARSCTQTRPTMAFPQAWTCAAAT